MKLEIKCQGASTMKVEDLLDFQGDLKTLSDENYIKFKSELLELGFSEPISVWKNPEGKNYILNGHQRRRTILNMIEEGIEVPKLPINFVEADDIKQAKRKVLALTSQYGQMTEAGLEDFCAKAELDVSEAMADFRFPELEIEMPEFDLEPEETEGDDEVSEEVESITALGDLWELGEHRLLCGDSTDKETIERLMDGHKADMVFTDPPYGMKKENEGILNDNLNYSDLLEFNKKWIPLSFEYSIEVGSWYCWGIDEPLMDIYSEIIKPMIRKQEATFRNILTWNKGNGQGQLAEEFRSYPNADEKCLFVMKGVQGFNNNADNYYEGWEPIRLYIDGEMKRAGWNTKTMASFFNMHPRMADHWRSRSQFCLVTREQYERLQKEAKGKAFKKEYEEIKKEYEEIKKEYEEIKKEYYSTRAYFDNTHDNMNNVWNFQRTSQEEREGTGSHATPKPLELCERGIRSSSKKEGLVLDMFLGSGSTLIACEKTNRKCYGMELDEHYCDVIVNRYTDWCEKNDKKVIIKRNGESWKRTEDQKN